MDTGTAAIIIAACTLLFNVLLNAWGGGWKLSTRLAALENSIAAIQAEIKKLSDVLIRLADMRGELRVMDTRITAAEQGIREIRHGDGFVRGQRGIDREF